MQYLKTETGTLGKFCLNWEFKFVMLNKYGDK